VSILRALVRSVHYLLLALLQFALCGQAAAQGGMPLLTGARVTVLVDNLSLDPLLKGEYGASFFLETGQYRVLFDTGGGKSILGNAQILGVSFHPMDAIILSHQHEDHTGGLKAVLSQSGPVKLFVHPAAFGTHYWKDGTNPIESLTFPLSKPQLAESGVTLVETKHPTEVCPGIMVTGEIPRTNTFEDTGVRDCAFLDAAAQVSDPILEDQAAFFQVPEGIVVILGCGHAGVVNTMDYVCKLSGKSSIYAVIGGTHLLSVSPDRMQQTILAFQRLHVQRMFLSHCTGARANAKLEEVFPEKGHYPSVGTRLLFGTFPDH
jgi:7,8-dihydropterin-6-yl-methyl-4-(beta-D-ribofuranosyl)aminobenzene 5'-phosphate synthase